MLSLNDKKWGLLSHAYGSADDIPEMILKLKQCSKIDLEEDDLLYGYLCHQYTTYSATYAAIPHIAEIAFQENQTTENKTLIVEFCGSVHALRDWDNCFRIKSGDENLVKQLTLQIEKDYLKAVEKIKPLAEQLLASGDLNKSHKSYIFYVFLAFEGLKDLSKVFIFSNYEEFSFKCSKCRYEIYILQKDNKLVPDESDYPFDLKPAKINLNFSNYELPSKEQIAEWTLFYAEKYDVTPVKYQIPYLFGEMICPHCSKPLKIIDELYRNIFDRFL